MKEQIPTDPLDAQAYDEPIERMNYDFGVNRRAFVQVISTGLLVAAGASPALAQRRGFGGAGSISISARVHIAKDGGITVFTGKVEAGQGARAELMLAAAEELCVPASAIELVMADTSVAPDDGITAGSRSTPSTVPAVRRGAAAARELLMALALKRWNVERDAVSISDGKAIHTTTGRALSYADLAASEDAAHLFEQKIPPDVALHPAQSWKALGHSTPRPNGREIVTGAHKYPSDIARPGMLYGKVLRAPAYGAKLVSIDPGPAKALEGVQTVRDDQFVGVVAPTSARASDALEAIAKTAKWERTAHSSSKDLFAQLKAGVHEPLPANPFQQELAEAKHVLRQSFHSAYIQHAPLEPRSALAEWAEGKLTVWTGTQNPFGCRNELARAFHVPEEKVRVVAPDFGGGFGGKHSGEATVEAARLAQAAGRPVLLRWTREEEFTWAYFRPAAVIEIEAGLDGEGSLTSWHFININSGGAALETPYRTGKSHCRFVGSDTPLRQGSYRSLAASANTFARESFMDELAAVAGADPLAYRLKHLENPRLRTVLETAAQRFGWSECVSKKTPNVGVGLACGIDKGGYVAACAEIELERDRKRIRVRRVTQVYDCGAIVNPINLHAQVQGAILMGLGPALREEMRFENGQILNASFGEYQVPRFDDVPQLDIHLVDRPEVESAGAGETPIIAIAPAIANGLVHAGGPRVRQMPIRLPEWETA